jgi:hypothetical protein
MRHQDLRVDWHEIAEMMGFHSPKAMALIYAKHSPLKIKFCFR